jgi:hypothetical protein
MCLNKLVDMSWPIPGVFLVVLALFVPANTPLCCTLLQLTGLLAESYLDTGDATESFQLDRVITGASLAVCGNQTFFSF